MMVPRWLGAGCALALAGCVSPAPVPGAPPRSPAPSAPPTAASPPTAAAPWIPPDAAAGVTDAELAALLVDHWSWSLEHHPIWATRLGVRRFDDRVEDRSHAVVLEARRQTRRWLAEAERIEKRGALSDPDATTLRLFLLERRNDLAAEACEFHLWSLDPRGNPVTRWNELPELHGLNAFDDARRLLARYRAIPGSIDAEIANLALGASRGLYANAHSARIVVGMARAQAAQPLDEWPLLAPARPERPGWPAEETAAWRRDLRAAAEAVRPALERYAAAIEKTVLPHARGADAEGLAALPDGAACYAARVRAHTSLDLTPTALHELGLSEIARIDRELATLGKKVLRANGLPAVLEKLRSDRKLYFDSADAVEQKAASALASAKSKMSAWFGILPRADCIIRRIPDYEAPFTTIAYYRPPIPGGAKPGEYFVNVLAPETRPRYEAEVLAFHESIPGHHLQIAIAQELPALPGFRKHAGMTAYVEGWGLYTERLGDEMGLYSGDLDRIGVLSFDAWRASRLVVDTGIHALGWNRERAVRFMLEHTALAENNIRNEIDRYIVWPGQALAYKVGQLEILRLRDEAKAKLGARFDIRAFHDTVLGRGAVSLPELRLQVEAWVDQRLRAAP